MKITTYLPSHILAPFVREYKIIESDDDTVNEVLPDTAIVLAFRIQMPKRELVHDWRSLVSGVSPTMRRIPYAQGMKNLLVLFREGGAAAFLPIPLHELLGRSAQLNEIIPSYILTGIEAKLEEASTHHERLELVESFLLGLLATKELDPRISFAIQEIKGQKGHVSIKELARSVNISLDPFEKQFRRIIGISPKQFASIVKLRNAIQHYPHTRNLTDLAYEMHYFDQSHFIRDFKHFIGKTPGEFFRNGNAKIW